MEKLSPSFKPIEPMRTKNDDAGLIRRICLLINVYKNYLINWIRIPNVNKLTNNDSDNGNYYLLKIITLKEDIKLNKIM